MKPCEKTVLAVAVDLTPLRPGGANGDLKLAIFSMLGEAARQRGESLVFLFLTNSATHAEVRQFARPHDTLICVLEESGFPRVFQRDGALEEYKLVPPPPNCVQQFGADILYCPFGNSTFHVEGIPTVALIADLLHRDYPLTLTTAQIAERECYITQTLSVASAVQCISRSGVERVTAHYQVPEEKLFYTYLPIQARLEGYPAACCNFIQSAGIKAPFFFYPANLWKHKNHETLLIAYRLYRERVGDAAWDLVLTFHEDARRSAELRELAEALGISNHLHLPGFVSEADLRGLWQDAGALVFPSLHESFGIPLLEAMHYDVPVIAGTEFSLKEIAGDAALSIEARKPESIAKAMETMGNDPSLRESLRTRGRQRLKFFNLEIETRKLLDVWSALPQCSEGFPRKPGVFERPCALAVSTPASDDLWNMEVRVNSQFPVNLYSVYLDDAPYGSFSCSQGTEPVFRFRCRPQSRTLRVVVSSDETRFTQRASFLDNVVDQIVAKNFEGECVQLFHRTEMAVL